MTTIKSYVSLLLVLFTFSVYSQNIRDIYLNESFEDQPLIEFVTLLHDKYGLDIYYEKQWIEPYSITITFENTPVEAALKKVFENHDLTYDLFQDDAVAIYKKSKFEKVKSDVSLSFLTVGNPLNIGKYDKANIKGRILDGKSEETLIGATVYNPDEDEGTTTNQSGEFELTLHTGETQLHISYLGFEKAIFNLNVIENGYVELSIFEKSHDINEVTVVGDDGNVPASQIGMEQMTTRELKHLPAMLGEVDVLKGLTMLAGVQTVSEISSGFNVRGGNTDQNLILLNGSPVFNSSHMFGFLTLINPDVVEDVSLFKGNMPVKYGERVASVMEVDFKDGNEDLFRVYGGIGIINSRLTLDGPLTANKKLTMVAGGRSTYSNWILKQLPDEELSESVTNFYDVSAKLSYKFNQHNKISLMGYASNDKFSTSSQSIMEYGNLLANLNLHTSLSKTLFGEMELSHSEYSYRLSDFANDNPIEAYLYDNKLVYNSAGYHFTFHPSPRHNFEAGVKWLNNRISPGKINPENDESVINPQKMNDEKMYEWAAYIGDVFNVSTDFKISAGLRYTRFANVSKSLVYIYDPNESMTIDNVIDSLEFGANEVSASYSGIEPRLSFIFDLDLNTSLRFNYQRIRQYVYQLSNNAVVSPAETWKAADYHLKPLISDQLAVGLENDSWLKDIDFKAEVYYKKLQNLIEYKNGAQLIMNEHVETELIPTSGFSYGIELSAKKSIGRITGYASYVYSRTMRRNESEFENDNFWDGDYYRSIYDKPHDFSFNGTYHISKRWHISGLFTFISGRPVTLPEQKYLFDDFIQISYSERNKYRMQPYHRLDLSVTLDENLRKKRMWKGSWTFSVYNVYGRNNPYSVYYKKSVPNSTNDYRQYSLYKLSVIGIPVPTLTYNFRF